MTALPAGLPIRLDDDVRVHAGALAGGWPLRAVRLSDAGRRALAALEAGADAPGGVRALGRRLVDGGLAHPRPRPRMAAGVVTVVVPVRDRCADLDRCLGALPPRVPAIVVDDGSDDPAAVAEIARAHGARLIARPRTGGPAAARNDGLAAVETELVAFLDSDCVPSDGWLDALAGHFADPLVGAAAPRVRPAPVRRPDAVGRYLAARSPIDMGRREAPVVPGGPVPFVPTAALMVRRAALRGGAFDAALRFGEDVDLVWRLLDAGWRVRYDPRVEVRHREPESVATVLARRFRYGTSAAALASRHPDRLAPAVLQPWPTAIALLALSGRVAPAAVLAGQQRALLARRLERSGLPGRWATRWMAGGVWHAGLSAGRYAATFALPVAAAAATRSRRPAAALALLALPALREWRERRPALDPVRFTALALADDAAYGAGVWWSCLRARTARPLLPRCVSGSSRRARRS